MNMLDDLMSIQNGLRPEQMAGSIRKPSTPSKLQGKSNDSRTASCR